MAKNERDGRKGVLIALLSKLGLQSTASAFATWTGTSAVTAKAGLAALALASSGAAAGVGMWNLYGPTGTGSSSRVFFATSRAAEQNQASDVSGASQGASSGASSLDYLSRANRGNLGEGAPESTPAPSVAASETAATVPTPAPPTPTPKMIKGQGFGPSSTSSGGLRLPEQEGLAGGIGTKFQPVARSEPAAARQAALHASLASSRRMGLPQSRGASGQLALTNKMVQGNLRSSAPSSQGSGVTYDGGNVAGQISPPAAGPGTAGVGPGGEGLKSGPNAALGEIRKASLPPPGVGGIRNSTPYQWLIYSAIGTLFASLMLLIASNMLAKQAKKAPLSPDSAAKLKLAKVLASLSIAAAGATMGLGSILIGKYGQNLQGALFIGAAVILAFQATLALIKDSAAEEGKTGVYRESGSAMDRSDWSLTRKA